MARLIKSVTFEAMVVLLTGLAFGLVANSLSPRGLVLTRDYFPQTSSTSSPGSNPTSVAGTNNAPAHETVAARLASKGLKSIEREEVLELFRDPRYEQELIVFVDARDDRHYQEGHIPRALQFDRYYPERYLATVLPACLNAATVVVYCGGGECEDSEFTALALREAGVPAERILVYAGGMTDWRAHGQPVETGGGAKVGAGGGSP